MDFNEMLQAKNLERYAFFWSLARLIIAALSLFFGVSPILYDIVSSSLANSLLGMSYLLSGAAAAYLLYLWHQNGQTVFGGTNQKDKVMFLIMGITGLNLGLSVIINNNIGLSLMSNIPTDLALLIFKGVAIVYVFVAYYLWKRWRDSGEQLFSKGAKTSSEE